MIAKNCVLTPNSKYPLASTNHFLSDNVLMLAISLGESSNFTLNADGFTDVQLCRSNPRQLESQSQKSRSRGCAGATNNNGINWLTIAVPSRKLSVLLCQCPNSVPRISSDKLPRKGQLPCAFCVAGIGDLLPLAPLCHAAYVDTKG